MTNSEIVKILSSRLGKSQLESKRLLNSSVEIMKQVLDHDVGLTLPGLGTFKTSVKKKRKSFNPYHNKFMLLPARRVVTFHPGSTIKNELKNKRLTNE